MILDAGIATFYHQVNIAAPGAKPLFADVQFHQGYFGELSFETNPNYPTDRREDIRTDARIRIHQNRLINNQDRVMLERVSGEGEYFEITRAYHGRDDDSGELISDLNLHRLDGGPGDYLYIPSAMTIGTETTYHVITAYPSPGLTGSVAWSTSDANMVTVTAATGTTALLTAYNDTGTAIITASLSGLSATCLVTVEASIK